MKSKEDIVKILMHNLSSVYCDTCEYEDGNHCDYCHRKSMNWGISELFAKELAEKVLED